MKSFTKIFIAVIALIVLMFVGANFFLYRTEKNAGRPYIVEVSRIVRQIETGGIDSVDLSEYDYIINIETGGDDIYISESDYIIRKIDGVLYRFDYNPEFNGVGIIFKVNIILTVMAVLIIAVLIFIYVKILIPFNELKNIPYELAKGNLTSPIKENKSRFFGRFTWGLDLLREKIEQQRRHELDLQKEKKTLLLSLSHDIKTPLSAIKLYAKALSKGLYSEIPKQKEIAENINNKADEIEKFVSQIIDASRDDFLSIEVNVTEYYLSELVNNIRKYYSEKMQLIKTDFVISGFSDCIIKGDIDRSIEVLQNLIENAVKYGDGRKIYVDFSEEDGCIFASVSNSGCTLADTELVHIFESFWRGSNAENTEGSGLGLYICRNIMHKMNGEIFADTDGENITVTAVFTKA